MTLLQNRRAQIMLETVTKYQESNEANRKNITNLPYVILLRELPTKTQAAAAITGATWVLPPIAAGLKSVFAL